MTVFWDTNLFSYLIKRHQTLVQKWRVWLELLQNPVLLSLPPR